MCIKFKLTELPTDISRICDMCPASVTIATFCEFLAGDLIRDHSPPRLIWGKCCVWRSHVDATCTWERIAILVQKKKQLIFIHSFSAFSNRVFRFFLFSFSLSASENETIHYHRKAHTQHAEQPKQKLVFN